MSDQNPFNQPPISRHDLIPTVRYRAKGLVCGIDWNNDETIYPTIEYSSRSRLEDLEDQINKGIEDGSIDGGMGYQKIIGALMTVTTIRTIILDGKYYTNSEDQVRAYGNLTVPHIKWMEDLLGIY